ncbi:heavy metal-binding protein HIP-like [Saccostrea echinata]|uniref:heavy metal-binding protein HIP-like n=1 Tax=Saccostrea echinata TaxID=191078 RepID=UPI002A817311|nr:heavy metal-binding protein HIP-like [Saccostrea echinata]
MTSYPKTMCRLVLLLVMVTTVFGSMKETPQQIVNKYNNYRKICIGLGYQNLSCKADNKGKRSIAFQSSLSSTLENMGNQQTVIFDKVTLNEGKGYNKKTGVFTAPEEGLFNFSWTMKSKAGQYFVSEIVHDGKPIAYNQADGRGLTGYAMTSNTANIKMNKGDKAWIRTKDSYGKYASGGYWCNFSGNKL